MFSRLIALTLILGQLAFAGGTIKVELTPERMEACRRLLADRGAPLPADAKITGIEITAEDWVCGSCGHQVDGVPANFPSYAAKCDNCGSPMEPKTGELYKKNPEGNLKMTDTQIDAALNLGSNWTCTYCGSGGNRDKKVSGDVVKECETCGAPRDDKGTYFNKNTVDDPNIHAKPTEKHGIHSVEDALAASTPVVAGPESVKADRDEQASRSERYAKGDVSDFRQMLIKNKRGLKIGGGLIGAIGMGVFWYVTTRDKDIKAKVTYARWVQTVRVEQFQPVIERGKKSDIKEIEPVMPVNGQGGTPGARIIECTGNSCLYETYKWIEVDAKTMRGTYDQTIPGDPGWAQFAAPANGRVMTNTRYSVDMEYSVNGEKYTTQWRPETHEQFVNFKPGSELLLKIDPLKNTQDASPVGGAK